MHLEEREYSTPWNPQGRLGESWVLPQFKEVLQGLEGGGGKAPRKWVKRREVCLSHGVSALQQGRRVGYNEEG